MTTPRVSVLLPVYNAQAFLREAVESVLEQTFDNFELICVDDGSTDRSWAILRDYERKDARVRIVSRPNTGIVGALNDGLAAARGEYVARMDADDTSDPRRFAAQVAHLDEHADHVAVGTWVRRLDPTGSPAGAQEPPTEHEAIDEALLRGDGSALIHATLVMRRDVLARIGGWDSRYNWVEDLDLFLRLTEAGRVANLPQHLYGYRRHPESVCATRNALMFPRVAAVLREAYRRRGIEAEPELAALRPDLSPRPQPRGELYRAWACHAIHNRNASLARRHALAALRYQPLSPKTWRVVYWSLCA